MTRLIARPLALAALLTTLATPTLPAAFAGAQAVQAVTRRNVIVPQQRCYAPVEERLKITSVDADVRVNESVATTTLVITILNETARDQEAEMLLPVPNGAAVRSFGIDGLGDEAGARLLPRDEARRTYEEIVRTMRDPGLLEFAGYNFVKSSVFPVPMGKSQTVRLTYEHIISGSAGRFDYVLPRSERFENAATAWTFTMTIESARPISTAYSPSHSIVTGKRGSMKNLTLSISPEHAKEPGAFRVSYLLASDGVAGSIIAYPDIEEGGGYLMLLAGLPTEIPDDNGDQQRREVIVVIDRSGSMRGEKIEQARAAAIQILDGLAMGEAFNVIDYSDTIARFSATPVVKTETTLAEARGYLRGLKAEGGTNIHDALQEAVRQPVTDGTLPMVLFLTDGLATAGNTSEIDIRSNTRGANEHKRRIFTFGVGYDVNAPLLDKLAEVSRGASINVLPDEDIEVAVSTVFKRLAGPILSWPTIASLDADGKVSTRVIRDVMPAILPDLFEGDQLVVLARYTGDTGSTLRLSGEFLGNEQSFEFGFDPSAASTVNAFVPRLWATRRIANLVDQIRQGGANGDGFGEPEPSPGQKEIVEEIVRLSMRFGILTEYTAFLATEGDGRGVAMGLDDAITACSSNLDTRTRDRAGVGAVNQSVNIKQQQTASSQNRSNKYWNSQMEEVTITNVCQVHDQTLFSRSGKWIDSRAVAKAGGELPEPDRTIAFGSAEHFELVRNLAGEHRQGLLAFTGDIYVIYKGELILITEGC